MIWFIYGQPRTGKSLFGGLVDGVLPALKRGRRVYTNLPLIRLGVCQECKISVMEYNRLVFPITCIQDIFVIYDQDTQNIKREYLDTVFILDEFRALTGLNQKTEGFLTKILNVVSKSAVDFIFIAQLPSYFDAETRDLGEGCTVFERGDSRGKKHSSIEWLFDKKAGTPVRIGNRWDTEHWNYRERLTKYFRMYHSYSEESEEMMLQRGEDHRPLVFWKTRAFKLSVLVIVIVVFMICMVFYLFRATTGTIDNLTQKKAKEIQKENPLSLEPIRNKPALTNSDIEPKLCYEQIWVNDGTVTYKLNNGNYAYNPSYLIERCSRKLTNDNDKNR